MDDARSPQVCAHFLAQSVESSAPHSWRTGNERAPAFLLLAGPGPRHAMPVSQSVHMTPRRTPWRGARRVRSALTRTVVVAGAVSVNLAAVWPAWPAHALYVVVHIAVGGALAVAGLAMGVDPALRGVGRLMVLAGYLQALPPLSSQDVGPLSWLSCVLGPAALLPIGAVLLAYPLGDLSRPVERWWLLPATSELVRVPFI